ncbi:dTMP kinase, partial [Streptomyces sp. S6]
GGAGADGASEGRDVRTESGESAAWSAAKGAAGRRGAWPEPSEAVTVPTPAVTPEKDVEETAVLPPVRLVKDEAPGAGEVTAELPQPPAASAGRPSWAAGADAGAEETAVLPPVRGEAAADRVPPGFFRDEREDRTRELPQVDERGVPRRRPRSDWAEETPLDDLPSLADELLGSRRDDEDGRRR